MSFWMRKQTYFNQGFKGRTFSDCGSGRKGSANCNVWCHVWGLSPFWCNCLEAYSLSAPLPFYITHIDTHTLSHAHSNEKLLKVLRVLNVVIFIKYASAFCRQFPTSPIIYHCNTDLMTMKFLILFIILHVWACQCIKLRVCPSMIYFWVAK